MGTGLEFALVASAILGAGASAVSIGQALKKPPRPKKVTPIDKAEISGAGERERRRGRSGRESTILTGSQGLLTPATTTRTILSGT